MGNSELGLLLLNTTLLGPGVVCGLLWKDFEISKDYENGIIHVYRAMNYNDDGYKGFDRSVMCRLYPCYASLTEILLNEREKCKARFGDSYIDKNIISWDHGKLITPKKLISSYNSDIGAQDIPGLYIDLSNDDKIVKTSPDAKKQLYFEHFKYWARECGLSEDEIAYLAGTKPETTIALHYRDFKHPGSLYVLSLKTEKIIQKLVPNNRFMACGEVNEINGKNIGLGSIFGKNLFLSISSDKDIDISINTDTEFKIRIQEDK